MPDQSDDSLPPELQCPNCKRPLRYLHSYVMKQRMETQHDELNEHFKCDFGCGHFIRQGNSLMKLE
jgi:hypothetical protein